MHPRLSAVLLAACAAVPAWAAAAPAPQPEPAPAVPDASWVNVRAAPYLAKADGKSDDTGAIQSALDAVGARGGGVVYLPGGSYLVRSHLVVPAETSLVGIGRAPQIYTEKAPGTTLLAVEGAGSPDGPAFITLQGPDSVLQGLKVFYPDQKVDPSAIAYPWTVRGGRGDGAALLDVLLVNPYQAVDLATLGGSRHYIRGLYGQPLFKGIWVDKCYDIGRIRDVHFWPFWSQEKKVIDYTEANAVSFVFQRTDWEVVENIFSWGYHVGVEFSASKDGAMNGQMTDVAFDAVDIGIDLRVTQRHGVAISNLSVANDGRGTSQVAIWSRSPADGAVLGHTVDGKVVMDPAPATLFVRGGAFWGYIKDVVRWEGPAAYLSLSDSRVMPFTAAEPMIDIRAGEADIHDNSLLLYPEVVPGAKPGIGIRIGKDATSVVAHHNQLNANTIENLAGPRAQIDGNVP